MAGYLPCHSIIINFNWFFMKLLSLIVTLVFMNPHNKLALYGNDETMQNSQMLSKNNSLAKKVSIRVQYNEEVKLGDRIKNFPPHIQERIKKEFSEPKKFTLETTGTASFYYYNNNLKPDETVTESSQANTSTKNVSKTKINVSNYFKNFEKNYLIEQATLFDEEYLITKELVKINWKIASEKITIAGFNCKKATTYINDMDIEVWFTEDIPVSDGPEIYQGLPGLVLKVETPKKIIYATHISYPDNLHVTAPARGEKITQEEYDKKLNELKNKQDYTKQEGNKKTTFKVIRSN